MTQAPETVIADLLAEGIRRRIGTVGVLVRDVPFLQPAPVLQHLRQLVAEGIPLRIAYLQAAGGTLPLGNEFPTGELTTQVEQAERWRNDRDLHALIVVVASGDEAKLTSLEEFDQVSARHLKQLLVERAQASFATANLVQDRWWQLLGRDDSISLGQLIEYYLSLSGLSEADVKQRSSREVHRLGLLPDPALFDNPSESAIRRRLELNRDLMRRLQTLTERDRKFITDTIADEAVTERRTRLRRSFGQLRRLRLGQEGLEELTLVSAQELLGVKAKKAKQSSKDEDKPGDKQDLSQVIASALIDPADAPEHLDGAVSQVRNQLNQASDTEARPLRLTIELGDNEHAEIRARFDVINVVSKLIGEQSHGGVIRGDGSDIEEVLRRFQAKQDIIAQWTQERLDSFLSALDHDAARRLAQLFGDYVAKRIAILPLARILCADPLLVAASSSSREALRSYVESYQRLFDGLAAEYHELFREFGADVNVLIAHFAVLESIIVTDEHNEARYVVCAPTHPLFLWHYTEFCRIVGEQRDRLSEKDRALVVGSAKELPNFLTSFFVPDVVNQDMLPRVLPWLGKLGALPYFGVQTELGQEPDGFGIVSDLLRWFIDVYPYAAVGLRLVLIDPPDAGAYLVACCELADEGILSGAHVVVMRHRQGAGLDLQLDPEDEERVSRLFRATSDERRFTFEVRDFTDATLELPPNLAPHIVVAFDQTPGKRIATQLAFHPIQPLALTRRLQYRPLSRTVELEPAPGGIFAAHSSVVSLLDRSAQSSYLAVHQEQALRQRLEQAAQGVPWFALADRAVDRDLALGALRLYSGREGSRDVVAYASSSEPFRRALRETARQYNTAISTTELDGLLLELSQLLDAGVLALRPDKNGRPNPARVKGLLGTFIAARWYRGVPAEPDGKLLVSLDSNEARRWLHLSEDALRADLLGFSFVNGNLQIDILEVKSVQNAAVEYQLNGGVATGPAIEQLLSTRRLLAQVFAINRNDELITTPARREILREHVFRELTKGAYGPEARKAWVDRLEALFDGRLTASLHCQLVEVLMGVDDATLQPHEAKAADGEELVAVSISELNETGVAALVRRPPSPEGQLSTDGIEEPQAGQQDGDGTEPLDESGNPSPSPNPPVAPSGDAMPSGGDESLPAPAPGEMSADARPRAFLGRAAGSYGKPRDVWFDPEQPGHNLPNPHVSITGETGSGKTQAIKAILHELKAAALPVLILDFKDDYSQPEYAAIDAMHIHDASLGGLPFNPMVPPVDSHSGRVSPMNHVHQLADIIKRIYRLGDQQTYRLREALKEVFEHSGIVTQPFIPTDDQTFPPFDAVHQVLRANRDNEALLGRLSPIFDLGLFTAGESQAAFANLANQSTVIRLSQLPGDEVKNAVAEFFLMALYNYLIRLSHPHALRRVLVLDEAWRLIQSPFLEPLMREGRAFGVGVLIATQFPKDLGYAISGSTATKLYFSQTKSESIREIQRSIIGKTSGADADHLAATIRDLQPLSCILQNNQYAPSIRVSVVPYFQRV